MTTKKELEEQNEALIHELENKALNLEYATRIIWLIVNKLGGSHEITTEDIDNAQYTEVRISDTVDGGLFVETKAEEEANVE